jgi:tripartite ATP-independent transporter DctM subunit
MDLSPAAVGLIGILVFFLLIILGMPISYSMALVGFVGVTHLTSVTAASRMLSQEVFSTFSSYSLSVVPMFMLMGFFAYYSGIGSRLYNFAYKAIGHLPGGLAISTQMACAMFGAVCGSITATTATIGTIALPEMKKYNYDSSLSTASVVAGAGVGNLIPPSVFFIVYGIAAEQSIGRLFLAGILPGILLMLLFMITIYLMAFRNSEIGPPGPKATWRERFQAMGGGLWEIAVVFTISLGGLFLGLFSPTEAGGVGAAGVLLLTVIERKINFAGIKNALHDTAKTTAMIMLMATSAVIFGRFMSLSRIPFALATTISELALPTFIIMGFILLVYLILGLFIDALALVLLTTPIFFPVVTGTLGFDPIWWGVIIVIVAGVSVITPPVGMCVFIVKGIAPEVPMEAIFRGIWPFVWAYLVCIIILLLFPSIAVFLPNTVF